MHGISPRFKKSAELRKPDRFCKILDRFHQKPTKPVQNLIFEIWEKKIKNQPVLLKTERFFSLSNGFFIFVLDFSTANFYFGFSIS
jgi:hypothetical protein